MTAFEWNKVGTSFNISWLFKYMAGAKAPPDVSHVEKESTQEVQKDSSCSIGQKSFLKIMDIGVERIHDEHGGLGIPNSFLYWHWCMVIVYFAIFGIIFTVTTPITELTYEAFPWMTLVHKLTIFFHVWESLGLGVIHGPLHQKMSPPFQDWWYRLTPGTIKYNAPFWCGLLSNQRNVLDVLVEGYLTYIFAIYAIVQQVVTPATVLPLTLCTVYEFIFDYGQHIHTYGTQNMHFFVCMCFDSGGQLSGIQLFLTWFYFCSGFCKLGPTFQYMNACNLMTAKFMVDVPYGKAYREQNFIGHKDGDYRLKQPHAWINATIPACIEMLVPLLTWFSDQKGPVYTSIFVFCAMHAFIISTLIIDVFVWNFTDAVWFVLLFGVIHTGVDWDDFNKMPLFLTVWFTIHGLYVLVGHLYPNTVPYIVAHRHAAGNWSQGIMCIKKSAIAKLGKIKSHAGMPGLQPGWAGEWFGFHCFMAYVWNWNLPSRLLVPMVLDIMGSDGDGAPKDGMFHSTGDYIYIHSVLFFDALIAHLRFDGLSNVELIYELGRVCEFEPNECILAWAGAFPSFVLRGLNPPKASWKIIDASPNTTLKSGIIKQGTYIAADVMDPLWKKPSDLHLTKLPQMIANPTTDKKKD